MVIQINFHGKESGRGGVGYVPAVHGVALVAALAVVIRKIIVVLHGPQAVLKQRAKETEVVKSKGEKLCLVKHKPEAQPVLSCFLAQDKRSGRCGQNTRKRFVGKGIKLIAFGGVKVQGPAIKAV